MSASRSMPDITHLKGRCFTANFDKDFKIRKEKRNFSTSIEVLKKYGAIPKMAQVKTKYIKLNICSDTNNVNGEILKGKFKGRKLADLSDCELSILVDRTTDKETQELLGGYISFKESLMGRQS